MGFYRIIILKVKNFIEIRNLLHSSFEIGMFIKGIDGVLEVIGGFLLLLVNPARLNRMVVLFTQHELSEDPNDKFVTFLINTSHNFSVSSQHFGVFYLLSHGIVKIILVYLLLKKKFWAYQLSIVFLTIFVIYQIYRYLYSYSVWLIILSIFDILMIWLTWIEYNRINKQHAS